MDKLESTAGIIIPDSSKETKTNQGVILRVGENTSGKLKEGQTILFEEFSGREYEYEGKFYLVLPEESVYAVLEN